MVGHEREFLISQKFKVTQVKLRYDRPQG